MRTSFGIEIHAGLRRIAEAIEGLRDSGVNSPGENFRTLVHTYASRVRGQDDNERREIAIKEAQLTDEQYRRLPVLQRITERELPDIGSIDSELVKAFSQITAKLYASPLGSSLLLSADRPGDTFCGELTLYGDDGRIRHSISARQVFAANVVLELARKLGELG